MGNNDFSITLEGFNEGFAPLSHVDTETFIGNKGQASEMKADLLSKPGFITQSPALVNLTNGTQAGSVDQLIRFILDKPTAVDTTYGIGTTKLFKISSTSVVTGGSPSWPQVVTNMTEGESVVRLKANIYGFYNKASGGDILKMPLSTEVIDPTWGSVSDQALEKAPHPSAVKEDIMMFGNGRYAGTYIEGTNAINVKKLDFGEGAEVADVVFNSNNWWLAVNTGVNGRSQGQIYVYSGGALTNVLDDEAGIGVQKIGFLYVINGILYICYQELTSNSFIIGWLSERQIKPLRYFSGTLPDHKQKTLYKNTILFASSTDIWSCGAVIEQLPVQVSKLADGGFATLGGIAAPFGTPLIASTETVEGVTSCRLAKFSGFSTDSYWKSLFIDITNEKNLGKINTVIVTTKKLATGAKCEVTLEGNQSLKTSSVLSVTGLNKTRHVFNAVGLGGVEDVRAVVSYTNGNGTNDCPVRKIGLLGSYVER